VSAGREYHARACEAAKKRFVEEVLPSSVTHGCAIVGGIATTLADRVPLTGPI